MARSRLFLFLFGFLFLTSTAVMAQFPVISAKDVKTWMTGKREVVLIDARPADEYRAGHIPGAVNIYAENIKAEASRLPKDKSAPIIFYCRGAG
jgi:rhodanese-related sulfurtransferase